MQPDGTSWEIIPGLAKDYYFEEFVLLSIVLTPFRSDVCCYGGYLLGRWCDAGGLPTASPYREDRDKVRAR